jgi:hypothetical protein
MPADPARCNQPDGEPGVRLFAGHTGRVAGGLGWPVAGRGVTVQPIGLAIGPEVGCCHSSVPAIPRRRAETSPGHGPLPWDLGLFGGAPRSLLKGRGSADPVGCADPVVRAAGGGWADSPA